MLIGSFSVLCFFLSGFGCGCISASNHHSWPSSRAEENKFLFKALNTAATLVTAASIYGDKSKFFHACFKLFSTSCLLLPFLSTVVCWRRRCFRTCITPSPSIKCVWINQPTSSQLEVALAANGFARWLYSSHVSHHVNSKVWGSTAEDYVLQSAKWGWRHNVMWERYRLYIDVISDSISAVRCTSINLSTSRI